MNIADFKARLAQIKGNLEAGIDNPPVSVREMLRWAGLERRGYFATTLIKRALEEYQIETHPDFEAVHLDSPIQFATIQAVAEPVVVNIEAPADNAEPPNIVAIDPGEAEPAAQVQFVVGAIEEPAFRVSRLLAASQPPTRVSPECSLVEAVTVMMRHDFSQLPVMTTEREVKGIVTWASIATQLQVAENKPITVQACMLPHIEVPESESLFRVIDKIVEHSYVLVRGADRTITGIVTATDLSLQFRQLSEPFLLLGEIENHVRSLIDNKFTPEELKAARNPEDADRAVETVADLTLGESIRLLESDENWQRIGVPLDRTAIIRDLNRVRMIRNDVMHFDPDGITPEDHKLLFEFVQFLHQVRRIKQN